MSPLIRQLQDGDKHQRLLRKESRLVVQLTSIRQKQTYYSGSELSWLALRLAGSILAVPIPPGEPPGLILSFGTLTLGKTPVIDVLR